VAAAAKSSSRRDVERILFLSSDSVCTLLSPMELRSLPFWASGKWGGFKTLCF
jgi:hypothetical protein